MFSNIKPAESSTALPLMQISCSQRCESAADAHELVKGQDLLCAAGLDGAAMAGMVRDDAEVLAPQGGLGAGKIAHVLFIIYFCAGAEITEISPGRLGMGSFLPGRKRLTVRSLGES